MREKPGPGQGVPGDDKPLLAGRWEAVFPPPGLSLGLSTSGFP